MLTDADSLYPLRGEGRGSMSESRYTTDSLAVAALSIRQHTSAYVSIRQHTSAYVSIRQHTTYMTDSLAVAALAADAADDVGGAAQHTSAYVSIRQHTSAYVSIRQHTLQTMLVVLLLG